MPTPDLALATRKVTREGSTRICETAFQLANVRRKHVTVVHKANVLRVSDGLFLECARSVAKKYPDIRVEEQLIDSMAALLVRDASQFDVVVTTNMFGDILSDEAAEISGSIGLAESLNAGTEHAFAQAQHGSAPDIAGKDLANPSSLIGSSAMLLQWLGERHKRDDLVRAAAAIEAALDAAISDPATRTRATWAESSAPKPSQPKSRSARRNSGAAVAASLRQDQMLSSGSLQRCHNCS